MDTTADLPSDSTADLAPTPVDPSSETIDPTPAREVRPQRWNGDRPNYENSADSLSTGGEKPVPLPEKRAFGFYAFAACALIAVLFALQQHPALRPEPVPKVAATLRRAESAMIAAVPREVSKPTEATEPKRPKRESAGAARSMDVVTFESRSFATTEKAVAAVFIVKRTQAARGKLLVRWAAYSGSADAGIDFSDASGTVRFADGQRQLAIYVPLRNDLLGEADETFRVCLRGSQHARIGGKSCAEATIRDDDAALNPGPSRTL